MALRIITRRGRNGNVYKAIPRKLSIRIVKSKFNELVMENLIPFAGKVNFQDKKMIVLDYYRD